MLSGWRPDIVDASREVLATDAVARQKAGAY